MELAGLEPATSWVRCGLASRRPAVGACGSSKRNLAHSVIRRTGADGRGHRGCRFDLGTRKRLVPNGDCSRRRDTARAMSQENVEVDRQNRDLEVIREVYSRWERGDFTSWRGVRRLTTSGRRSMRLSPASTRASPKSARHGGPGWRRGMDSASRRRRLIAGSDGRYVVMQLFRGTGKASGLESEERSAMRGDDARRADRPNGGLLGQRCGVAGGRGRAALRPRSRRMSE